MALIHQKQIDGDLTNARVLTGSLKVNGSFTLTGSLDQDGDAKITGSFQNKFKDVNDYFSISTTAINNALKVANDGVLQLAPLDVTPGAKSGSLFYSGSDEFFLGFNN